MAGGQPILDKNGKPQTELKIRFDKILDLRIGQYTASEIIVLSTNNKDIPFERQITFFVFPWKVVIAIVLFVIFAGIGFFSTFRNIVRNIIKIFGKGKEKDNQL
jgi:hypothetical protein